MDIGRMRPGMTRVADAVQVLRTSGLGTWIAPVIALVVVGASTFPEPYGPTRNLYDEIAAFAIAVVTMTLWRLTENRAALKARLSGFLPVAATAMVVSCGWASLANNGGPFSILSS